MDIYDFFNSPDVAKHCRSIKHTFNALDSAIIINESYKRTLAEKQAAFKAIISEYPDMELPECLYYKGPCKSFHEALAVIAEHQKNMLEKFIAPEPGAVYQAIIYNTDTWKPDELALCGCFEKAYECALHTMARSYEEYSPRYMIIRKIYVDSNAWLDAKVTIRGGITQILDNGWWVIEPPDEYRLLDKYIYVPVPFKHGDLVEQDFGGEEKGDVYVFQNTTHDRGSKTQKYLDEFKTFRSSYMEAKVFYEKDGAVHSGDIDFYPNLRYCRHELKGGKRILKYISLHLQEKSKFDLGDLLQIQKQLTLEKFMEELQKQEHSVVRKFKDYDDLFDISRTIDGARFSRDKSLIWSPDKDKIKGEYKIPEGVSRVGWFAENSTLESVIIPDGVSMIGLYSFHNCTGLTKVKIPYGVTKISEGAFEGCVSLRDIKLPESLQFIGVGAFRGCASLTSVHIPAGMVMFEEDDMIAHSFFDCASLAAITVHKDNPRYSDAGGVLYNRDKTKLIVCPGGKTGEYIIPDGVIEIENGAFRGCGALTNVTIPDSVKVIGDYAFDENDLFSDATKQKLRQFPSSVYEKQEEFSFTPVQYTYTNNLKSAVSFVKNIILHLFEVAYFADEEDKYHRIDKKFNRFKNDLDHILRSGDGYDEDLAAKIKKKFPRAYNLSVEKYRARAKKDGKSEILLKLIPGECPWAFEELLECGIDDLLQKLLSATDFNEIMNGETEND